MSAKSENKSTKERPLSLKAHIAIKVLRNCRGRVDNVEKSGTIAPCYCRPTQTLAGHIPRLRQVTITLT
jgi:hypothetical protein